VVTFSNGDGRLEGVEALLPSAVFSQRDGVVSGRWRGVCLGNAALLSLPGENSAAVLLSRILMSVEGNEATGRKGRRQA